MNKSKKSNKKLIYIFISVLSFVLFTFVVKSHALDQFDFNTTVKIQDHVPRKFDTLFSIFSLIGSFEVLVLVLLVLIFLRKKLKGAVVIVIFLLTHFVEIFGKTFLHHPGPPFLFFRYDLPIFFPSSYVQPGSSYPSGHSFRSIFIATLIIFTVIKSKKIEDFKKIVLIVVTSLIAGLILFSRISLGEHWTTDVVGGALLGLASSYLALLFF